MTLADPRVICDSLNDERGTGGQSKLARLVGWHHSTVWPKLNGASPITQADELAIRQALVLVSRQKACPPESTP
jgi:DNA-binding transcriptional regulator YdaS (Cro superfamily)